MRPWAAAWWAPSCGRSSRGGLASHPPFSGPRYSSGQQIFGPPSARGEMITPLSLHPERCVVLPPAPLDSVCRFFPTSADRDGHWDLPRPSSQRFNSCRHLSSGIPWQGVCDVELQSEPRVGSPDRCWIMLCDQLTYTQDNSLPSTLRIYSRILDLAGVLLVQPGPGDLGQHCSVRVPGGDATCLSGKKARGLRRRKLASTETVPATRC